jgi:predicted ATP-dependent serine protease
MIAAPPGVGKSTFALALAVNAKVPTLYFSADTLAHTMSLRLLAMLTNKPTSEIEPLMEDDKDWASEILARADHIMWEFDSAPSLKDIEDAVKASRERRGDDVQLIVLDNAVDVTMESGGDEYGALRTLMRELKWWARETGAAFVVCHHTSEAAQGNPCPPRSALHGKIAQTPSLILTLHSQVGLMAVCAVKNRYGPADASGATPIWLNYEPANMTITDLAQQREIA